MYVKWRKISTIQRNRFTLRRQWQSFFFLRTATDHDYPSSVLSVLSPVMPRYFSSSEEDVHKKPLVRLSKDSTSKIAILELNSPSSFNALTVDMGVQFESKISYLCKQLNSDITSLSSSTSAINDDDDYSNIQALILTGASPSSSFTSTNKRHTKTAFSAGGDFAWLRSLRHNPPQINSDIMYAFYKSFLCIRDLPIPTIAAIQGPAIGAGACLGIACDLRVMSLGSRPTTATDENQKEPRGRDTGSTIGFTFTKLGIHPGMGGSHLLPLAVGQAHANEILLTGQVLTAEKSHQIGLVNHVVYDDYIDKKGYNGKEFWSRNAVMAKSLEVAGDIVSGHPLAVRSMTRSIRLREDNLGEGLEASLRREAFAQSMCYACRDWGEGLDALIERREPVFNCYHEDK